MLRGILRRLRSIRAPSFARPAGGPEARPGARLNVGSGRFPLRGWINLDIQDLPEVDVVADVWRGLPFREVAFVYAEHFIEHLTFPDAIAFLRSAHGALAARGRIRLSTPSLEWVWATHDPNAETPAEVLRRTFVANRAFYGWQHRFVWTRDLLAEAVEACGFREPRFFGYGESETPELRGLEQHDTYEERPDLPHVLVVEAGKGERDPARLELLLAVARESFLDHLRG